MTSHSSSNQSNIATRPQISSPFLLRPHVAPLLPSHSSCNGIPVGPGSVWFVLNFALRSKVFWLAGRCRCTRPGKLLLPINVTRLFIHCSNQSQQLLGQIQALHCPCLRFSSMPCFQLHFQQLSKMQFVAFTVGMLDFDMCALLVLFRTMLQSSCLQGNWIVMT